MSMNDDEVRLRSYLLRIASEEEMDQIEDSFLATSKHSALITDVENRLISDYVQDRLPQEQREAFDRNYLVTAERREHLAVARAVAAMSAEAATSERVPIVDAPSLWSRFWAWIAAPGPVVGFATAAAAVFLLIGNVVLFNRWRDQAHQAELASQRIRTLQASKERTPTPAAARILSIPVLKVEETSLSLGEQQRLRFRLPSDLPETLAVPIEIPAVPDGAMVDVTLSSAGHQIWSENGITLRRVDKVLQAELSIPFGAIRAYVDKPLKLAIVERGHAILGSFQLVFESGR